MRTCCVDKLRIVLAVTWVWAWVGFKLSKVFEYMFKMLLYLPNNWLAFSDGIVQTSDGHIVNILNAYNETGEITNKLKLFLRWYWENGGGGQPYDTNGFDFRKYSKLLNSSILYCSYLLTKVTSDVEDPWQDVRRFIVTQNMMYRNEELNNGVELDFNHVDFQDEQPSDLNNLDITPLAEKNMITVDMVKKQIDSTGEPVKITAQNWGSDMYQSVVDGRAVLKFCS